jgi:ParB/RepB/Spo0J family partition protein
MSTETVATKGPRGIPGAAPAPSSTLPLRALRPSSTNPRKSFDQGQLAELAESIKTTGVLQPILVRPWKGKDEGGALFEIVAGERRFRGAQLAGLEGIPAVVRDFSDAEVLEAQLVENLQRADLHALEEADGYRRLMAKGHDVARIAERTGRSVKYVYDRVKLLSLTKQAQEAFRRGKFTAGHAILLARLRPADQERALQEPEALFTEERLLFSPEELDGDLRGDLEPMKPRSVREFQGWIDAHVKLEAAEADPMLFPELAQTVRAAAEEKEKVVRITHELITPEDAREGPRPILGRSWKRADGTHGSKQCDRSVIGTIVIGPGRGEAFRVCVDKKRCRVHWGELIKAAKKREREVAKAGGTGEDREALRRRKEAEEKARLEAEHARWRKATPAILEAVAAALKKAPAGAGGALGRLVLEGFKEAVGYGVDKEAPKLFPPGKTAEQLVRHVGFQLLMTEVEDPYEPKELAKRLRGFGVDVAKILAATEPEKPKA